MEGQGGGGDWSALPEELLILLSEKLSSVIDGFNFSYVCKSWGRSSLSTVLSVPKPPLLMLSVVITREEELIEEQQLEENQYCAPIRPHGFLGLVKGELELINKVYELDIPEARRCRCIGSKGNWMVTIDLEFNIRILNPFSRVQFDLPPQSALPFFDAKFFNTIHGRDFNCTKVVLSSTPSIDDNNRCIAITIHCMSKDLYVARPGDASWTPIKGVDDVVSDAIFFKGKFYAVCRDTELFVCDFNCHTLKAIPMIDFEPENKHFVFNHFLVEWLGELLLVVRYASITRAVPGDFPYYETIYFRCHKFDFGIKEWQSVKSLGRHSLFLGFNTSVSVLASDSSIFRENCIYFTEDHHLQHFVGMNMKTEGLYNTGVYDLKTEVVHRLHKDIVVKSRFSPPVWIVPGSIVSE